MFSRTLLIFFAIIFEATAIVNGTDVDSVVDKTGKADDSVVSTKDSATATVDGGTESKDKATGILDKVDDTVDKATDVVDKVGDTVDKATDVVDKVVDTVGEVTDPVALAILACEANVTAMSALDAAYARANPPTLFTPEPFPPPPPEQGILLHHLEENQRLFECLGDHLHEYHSKNLKSNLAYKAAVEKCKLEGLPDPKCDPSHPYKAIDGTCNNLYHPSWGRAFGCFKRLFSSNYEGVAGFRKSVIGRKDLPNAREISLKIAQPCFEPSEVFTSLFIFFGQMIAHDIAQFPFTLVAGVDPLDCCRNPTDVGQHPMCMPVKLRPNDRFYSLFKVSCFGMQRVVPCNTCSVGKRLPVNFFTAYLDLSNTYGQTHELALILRAMDGTGKLVMQQRESEKLLPPNPVFLNICGDIEKGEFCFQAGDNRANQHIMLMIIQTLFAREHNRVAEKLKEINPHWDGEKLYHESRKIVIAEFQAITYKEYLPILLGPDLMNAYGLNCGRGGRYDPRVDASILVEFNGAAFRLHSLVPRKFAEGEYYDFFRLSYFQSEALYNKSMSSYLSKTTQSHGEKYDRNFAPDVTQYLYRGREGKYGFDLFSFNVQRGRDVGLPSYVQIREILTNRRRTIWHFEDLTNLDPECLKSLKKIYSHVRDIDFFVGIICEKIPDNMIISETAAVIIAEQFRRLKYGDRFFFEFDKTLTFGQKQELYKASLSKVICDNTKVDGLQLNAMLFPNQRNPYRDCREIPGVDLGKWKEKHE